MAKSDKSGILLETFKDIFSSLDETHENVGIPEIATEKQVGGSNLQGMHVPGENHLRADILSAKSV